MKLITPAIASEPYTAEAPSFSTSTRSIAANGITARFTPCTPFTSPAKPFTRLPFIRTSVRPPVRPRRFAVCAEKVVTPIVLLESTLPTLALAPTSCSSSIALVAPERLMSSLVMTVTGRAVSPSTRLMLEPVTSMRSFAAGWSACCASAGAAKAPAIATAMAVIVKDPFSFLRFMCLSSPWNFGCRRSIFFRGCRGERSDTSRAFRHRLLQIQPFGLRRVTGESGCCGRPRLVADTTT